jgi:hypothetical protein
MAKTKIIIIAEKGANKYEPGKMQGIGIKMYILNNTAGLSSVRELKGKDAGPCHCYIIGKSPKYCESIEKAIRTNKAKWKIVKTCKNEDEIMKLENREFLKTVEESAKLKKKTMSKLQEEIINIKAIVFVAVVKCVALKDLFLVDDTVAVALQFIVTRQTAVQSGNSFDAHSVVRELKRGSGV